MSKLIRVAKDGAHLSVDPSCLKAHEAAGWVVAADQTPGEHDLGQAEADDVKPAKLTKAEIVAELEALKVEFDPKAKVDVLQALLTEAQAAPAGEPAAEAITDAE